MYDPAHIYIMCGSLLKPGLLRVPPSQAPKKRAAIRKQRPAQLLAKALAPAHGRFQLFFDLAEIERARRLARRIVLHRLQKVGGEPLHGHENEGPVEHPVIISVRVMLRPLERIAPQIEQQRNPKLDERGA